MQPLVLLALATVYLVYSSTYLAVRVAVQTFPPLLMGGVRFLIAGGVLYAALRLRGAPTPPRVHWLSAVPSGTLYFFVGSGLASIAGQHVASGLVAVACAAMPLWASIFGLAFGQPPSAREWIGLGLGFAGVVLLGSGDLRADPSAAALLALTPIGWAASAVLSTRLPAPPGAMAASLQMLAGGVSLLVGGLLRDEAPPVHVSGQALVAFAYLTIFGSIIAYSAYVFLLQNTRRTLATSHAYVNPVLAVGLGATLGGERLDLATLIAALLIATGVGTLMTNARPLKAAAART